MHRRSGEDVGHERLRAVGLRLLPGRRRAWRARPRTGSCRDVNGDGRPALIGFVLNATDKRHQQCRAVVRPVVESSGKGELPSLLESHWPPSPAFEAATDENRDPRTLKERFGTSTEHARKVARELEKPCDGHVFNGPPRPVQKATRQRLGLA